MGTFSKRALSYRQGHIGIRARSEIF
jgi:hypothetical protein